MLKADRDSDEEEEPSSRRRGTSRRASHAAVNEEYVTQVGPHDVLMGRGAPITSNPGNAHLRHMVAERQAVYMSAIRQAEKHLVAVQIIQDITSQGGRFLRKVGGSTSAAPAAATSSDHPGETQGVDTSESNQQQPQGNNQPIPDRWVVVRDQRQILVKVKQLLRDMGPQAMSKRLERRRYRYRKLGKQEQADDEETDDLDDSERSESKVSHSNVATASSSRASLPAASRESADQRDAHATTTPPLPRHDTNLASLASLSGFPLSSALFQPASPSIPNPLDLLALRARQQQLSGMHPPPLPPLSPTDMALSRLRASLLDDASSRRFSLAQAQSLYPPLGHLQPAAAPPPATLAAPPLDSLTALALLNNRLSATSPPMNNSPSMWTNFLTSPLGQGPLSLLPGQTLTGRRALPPPLGSLAQSTLNLGTAQPPSTGRTLAAAESSRTQEDNKDDNNDDSLHDETTADESPRRAR